MAPNFLSKLVKSSPSSHTRDRSSESSRARTPSPARRRGSSSANNSTVYTNTSSLSSSANNSHVPSVNINNTNDGNDTTDSGSTHPSVTIVPPSPHSNDTNGSMSSLNVSDRRIDGLPERGANGSSTSLVQDRRATSAGKTPTSFIEDDLPTPTTNRPGTDVKPPAAQNTGIHTPVTGAISRPRTPTSSTTNNNRYAGTTPPVPVLELPEVRRQASNTSLNRLPSLTTPHMRAATTPAPRRSSEDSAGAPNGIYAAKSPIVESPKAIRPTPESSLPMPNIDPLERSYTTASTLFNVPRDSDAPKKKRPWRRSNPSRKPTGLASAIAASGLAMANPGMSVPQQVQLSPPSMQLSNSTRSTTSRKSSIPGSPPYLSASPASSHIRQGSLDFSPPTGRSNRSSKRSTHTTSPQSHSRRPSISVHSENNSENYGEDRGDYSGLEEETSDDDDSESEDDLMDLDLGEDDIPVTGFAVASNKRNADFHELFPNIPEGDYLIEDYGCALQREILIQGRIYISENHICFHANIFGWITDLSIPIYEITTLEKKMTAFVIPNAIQITTRQAKYTFASFLARDTTFDVIFNIWRLARPEDSASIMSSARSIDGPGVGQVVEGSIVGGPGGSNGIVPGKNAPTLARKVTQCACGKDGTHFSETALETVLPGTPDRIHNLIFASGFMKDFMRVNQKLLDIQISDWSPTVANSTLLARNMSYIKPLNGSLGPKQTKCEIRDETIHCDFSDYVVTLTTTRTPDVPSGGVFSVKTRTCIMWASAVSTRVIVTTQVEWTGRSFIKGIIERSAIDGQKVYHADLDKAMRAYIQEHQSEFMPEGIDIAAIPTVQPEAPVVETPPGPKGPQEPLTEEERKKREHERNQRGLQWAWDTFKGASQVAKQSTTVALELVGDAWEQSTSTAILYFVIVILVFSNLWTLMKMGSKEEAGRRKEIRKTEEREKWVQGVVTAVWDELASGKGIPVGPGASGHIPPIVSPEVTSNGNWRDEVAAIQKTLDNVEQRVQLIRESLKTVESLNTID